MNHRETELRSAKREDLPALVALLRDDSLGNARESDNLEDYLEAFEEILADPSELFRSHSFVICPELELGVRN
jgi:N-acetylglutamate synthase-like GNAT family acetyltransferase